MSEQTIIPQIIPQFLEKILNRPTIISLIVMFQGAFGGLGIVQTPKLLKDAVDNPASRFLFITAIAFTGTGDLETAIVTTALFFVFLHLLRTKEEREKLKYPYF